MQVGIIGQAAIAIEHQRAIKAGQACRIANCSRYACGGFKSRNIERVISVGVCVFAAHIGVKHISGKCRADSDIAGIIIRGRRIIHAGDCNGGGVLRCSCAVRDIIGDNHIDALTGTQGVEQGRVNCQRAVSDRGDAIS